MNCACISVGKAGYGAVLTGLDVGAGLAQLVEHRVQRAGQRPLQPHVALRDRAGDQEAARFDPVRHHAVLRAVQALNAFDRDPVGARAANASAHPVQAGRQIGDFGFARRVLDHRFAIGQRGGHHQVLGAGHRHQVGHDPGAAQPPVRSEVGHDVAVLDPDLRAQRLQTLQVLIDRAGADRAAARQAHARRAGARQQRPKHDDRGPHRLDQVVRGLGRMQAIGVHRDRIAVALDFRAHAREQPAHRRDVRQHGHVAQHQLVPRQQPGCQHLQRRVLGAADRHAALQPLPAPDSESVHLKSIETRLCPARSSAAAWT
jgi:hypothetical protein